MTKIQRISNLQYEFSFFNAQENFDLFYSRFLQSDLGKIYTAIPFDDLVQAFKIKEFPKEPDTIFSPKGKIALMFLKHYAACSDKRLIEQPNGNINYQFFCDIHVGINTITNYKIVSQIRCELVSNLDIDSTEKYLLVPNVVKTMHFQCISL